MLGELLPWRSAGWPVRPCQTQTGSCRALSPFPFSPILLFFPLHRWCIQVLHFKPVGGAPRTVGGILALRHDAFEPQLAGVGEDGRAVALDVFVEPDAGAGLGYDRCERGLADLKRIAPQVVPVQLDEVEGIKKDAPVSDSFAIDDARLRAQMGQRLDDGQSFFGRPHTGVFSLMESSQPFGDLSTQVSPAGTLIAQATRRLRRGSFRRRLPRLGVRRAMLVQELAGDDDN